MFKFKVGDRVEWFDTRLTRGFCGIIVQRHFSMGDILYNIRKEDDINLAIIDERLLRLRKKR